MKAEPAPDIPGNTPWERLDNAVRSAFSIDRDALLKEEAKLKRGRERKRAKKSKNGHNVATRAKRPNGADSIS